MLLGLALSMTACGDDEGHGGSGGGESTAVTSAGNTTSGGMSKSTTATTTTSSSTTASTTSGANLTPPDAGINGCHALFVDPDGVCRPLPSKCAKGTIPDIDAGCVPVGVPGCAPEFVDERGVCLPQASQCAAGSFPVPTLGCVSIDGEQGCGTGTWGNVADDPLNVYVDASFPNPGSDGSKAKPFVTLEAALTAAAAGARVVLAAGTYQGGLSIAKAVEVRGVCASQVTITAPASAAEVVALDAPAGGVIKLSDLTIQAPTQGIRARTGTSELLRVRLRETPWLAVRAVGATTVLKMDRTLVEDTTLGGPNNQGRAIASLGGATILLTRSAIIRARTEALLAQDATLEADDVFVADTAPDNTVFAVGAEANGTGTLKMARVVSVGNGWGVMVYDTAHCTLEDSVLGKTTNPDYGQRFQIDNDASADLRRVAFVDGDRNGLTVYDGTVTAEHLLFADFHGTPNIAVGGLFGGLTIDRSTITRVQGHGIELFGNSKATGLVIHDVTSAVAEWDSAGILIGDTGDLDQAEPSVDRCYVGVVEDFGILVVPNAGSATPAAVKINRTLIEGISGREGGTKFGVGIAIGAPNETVRIEDTRIENVHGAAIQVTDTPATIVRSLIRGVMPSGLAPIVPKLDLQGAGSTSADGILFHMGTSNKASVTLEDVWIENASVAGLSLSTNHHTLTRVRALGGTFGLRLLDGATATIVDSDFSDNVNKQPIMQHK